MTSDQAMRSLAEKATDGPWEVGDHYHIQGANYCQCRDANGPLVWEGKYNINGKMMPTHIHRKEEVSRRDTSIYTATPPDISLVALSTQEYHEIDMDDAQFIAACREWVPDALRRLDNARVIARKLLEASGAYSTLDATPEFPEAYQLAQDLYEALDGDK